MSGQSNVKQSRREERKEAFYLLFEKIFRSDSMEMIIADAVDARDAGIGSYTRKLITGVEEKQQELDKHIEENLKGWKINRISKVSLTIMRLAVYEMLYVDSVPVSVSINEAVELAKEFATPADGSYVNGVLGAIAKSIGNGGEG